MNPVKNYKIHFVEGEKIDIAVDDFKNVVTKFNIEHKAIFVI